MLTIELFRLKQQNNFSDFYERISNLIPSLRNYITAKLKIIESKGYVEKGFFSPDDILDDVYLNVFELITEETSETDLRRLLFDKAIQKISQKTITEHYSINDISIDDMLDSELKNLAEPFTVDGDGDLMPNEELDDISYNQEGFKEQNILLDTSLVDELENNLKVNSQSFQKTDKSSLLGELLYYTPILSKAILELHLFGEQTHAEIAEIFTIEEAKVQRIIEQFKLRKVYSKG